MGDFYKAFEAIDEDHSGEITVEELRAYMVKNNYKENFVQKWMRLFDEDGCGVITYDHYCNTLGLVPRERASISGPSGQSGTDKKCQGEKHSLKEPSTVAVEAEEVIQMEVEEKQHSSGPSLEKDTRSAALETEKASETKEKKKKSKEGAAKVEIDASQKKSKDKKTDDKKEEAVASQKSGGNKEERKKKVSEEEKIEVQLIHKEKSGLGTTAMEIDTEDRKEKNVNPKKNAGEVAETKKKVVIVDETKKGVEKQKKNDGEGDENIGECRRPQGYPLSQKRGKKSGGGSGKPYSAHRRKTRASLQPGTVLILLAGPHRGKRVVCVAPCLPASGMVLVTGPLRLNGCPLRRVPPSMVIATSTRLDLGPKSWPQRVLEDGTYARQPRPPRTESLLVRPAADQQTHKYTLTQERKDDQKTVDSRVIAAIRARDDKAVMAKYLRRPFSLRRHDYPHAMIF